MDRKVLFKKAHELTRNIVKEFKVDYRVQFQLCLKELYKDANKFDMDNKQVEEVEKVFHKTTLNFMYNLETYRVELICEDIKYYENLKIALGFYKAFQVEFMEERTHIIIELLRFLSKYKMISNKKDFNAIKKEFTLLKKKYCDYSIINGLKKYVSKENKYYSSIYK